MYPKLNLFCVMKFDYFLIHKSPIVLYIYLTNNVFTVTEFQKLLRTVWFRPNSPTYMLLYSSSK